jgi:hypothetical protein
VRHGPQIALEADQAQPRQAERSRTHGGGIEQLRAAAPVFGIKRDAGNIQAPIVFEFAIGPRIETAARCVDGKTPSGP